MFISRGSRAETGFVLSIAVAGAGTRKPGSTACASSSPGLFDRFPELQVIIGHMGEGVPAYALVRSNQLLTAVARNLKP